SRLRQFESVPAHRKGSKSWSLFLFPHTSTRIPPDVCIAAVQWKNTEGLKQKHKKQPFSDASASHLSLVLWHV
ncbi:MAG: hypothetical protein SPH19_02545, partial [Sodaliphilus sp.]|nr:hypothetical protein [Sodaliphilus sp.]